MFDPQFKPVQGIYEARLRQFLDEGDYKELNLPRFYDKGRVELDQDRVKVWWYQVEFEPGSSPVAPDKRPSWESVIKADREGKLKFREARKGQAFGPSWSTTWFKVELKVPKEWRDSQEQLAFQWDCENEGIVIDPETLIPKTAFSGGERTEYLLPAIQDGRHYFYIEAGNNGMFGCGNGSQINPPDDNRIFTLRIADLVRPDWEARALRIDFWMLGDAARELPDDSWQKHRARDLGNRVMNMFDSDDRSSVKKCREFLKNEYFDQYNDSEKVYDKGDLGVLTNVFGMGNCHIDTAWLWPFAETRRKIVRSWSSQCTLMDSYPEYQFVASQAQQFKWLLQEHPSFFKDVLTPKVQQSQFFPIGGSWVENDTNIPSGESLARQFLLGQRFFLKHFGLKSSIFWLPDTFGYSSQVPQICCLSGIDKFLTQKLSWNNINSFPHSTFNWAGIDGSQLLTHMPPGNTYTALAHFGDVLRTANQNKSAEFYGSGLMLYGIGDGGGGPTTEMLEKMRRIRSLSNRNGNVIPKLQVGNTVDEFYEDIMQKTDRGKRLPTWSGELYFEFHRGTYTSQAQTKKLMRFSEIKLHDLEWLASKASILVPDQYEYPINHINQLWEDVLLCQFHDVLPGSCIEMVYKYEAVPMLKAVIDRCDELINDVLKALQGNSGDKLVKTQTIAWPKSLVTDAQAAHEVTLDEKDDHFILSNGELTARINSKTGTIQSIVDFKSGTEFLDLEHGRNKLGANQFVIFDDKPLSWQAWDTELYSVNQYKYLDKPKSVKIGEHTKDICTVEVVVVVSENCKIKSNISLRAVKPNTMNESTIDIVTVVENWDATNKFLKVEFPVNVRNEYASYETQFGITKRPTHYNTSWDVAKFEVCHHKFADYSEFSKGVSILNDCKYGFSTHGNLMRLSLLRSPKAPDAHADMGTHEIRYSIYPHKGQLSSKTVKLGLELNFKNQYHVSSKIAKRFDELIGIEGDDNIVLSNLKRGEEDQELKSNYALQPLDKTTLIVRVYESLGGESNAALLTCLPIKKVDKIDNLEMKSIESLPFKSFEKITKVPIKLKPFEIASYRLTV